MDDEKKTGLRLPTTGWVRQRRRQCLSCRCCAKGSGSASRSRTRLQRFGDRSHKSGAARREENGRLLNEATARRANSGAPFGADASHTHTHSAHAERARRRGNYGVSSW